MGHGAWRRGRGPTVAPLTRFADARERHGTHRGVTGNGISLDSDRPYESQRGRASSARAAIGGRA